MTTSGLSISRSRRGSRAGLAAALGLAGVVAVSGPVTLHAQEAAAPDVPGFRYAAPILTLDQEALFRGTAFGQRVQEDLARDSSALAAENRRIEGELIAEEQRLTERRSDLSAADFAPLARAFDARVQAIRAEQAQKSQRLQQRLEQERQAFLSRVGPILGQLMSDRGAVALLDAQAILLAFEGVDITRDAIDAVDRDLGDGRPRDLTAPPDPAPAAPAAPAPEDQTRP